MISPLSLLLALATAASAQDSKPGDYPQPNLLVEAADLARPETSKRFLVLDTRARDKYQAGHVPGSIAVNVADWSKAFAAGQDAQAWQARLGGLGITEDTPVVVYGDDAREYARVWWILHYWGVRDARLLNGGWQAWQAADQPVSKEAPPARAAASPHLSAHDKRLATKDQVLGHVKDNDIQIVDARSEQEHCGEARTAKRNGSIPAPNTSSGSTSSTRRHNDSRAGMSWRRS